MRDKLNKNKPLGVGVAIAVILAAGTVLAIQMMGKSNATPDAATHAFYSDGSIFKDDINKIVPFDHNGKQASRADVFQGVEGKQFVGLVYRHTDSGRRQMEAYLEK